MPIEYPASSGGGVLNEHRAVRECVGLFDVSHLGKALVSGPGAVEFLNSVLTNDLTKIADGQAQYTLICDPESGGVIDDLIAYRYSLEKVFLIPNAANTADVVARLKASAPSGVVVEDQHEKFSVLAIQGPSSEKVLRALGIDSHMEYMSFTSTTVGGYAITLCRTGYTGERGFEILSSWTDALHVWNLLLDAVKREGGLPAGLGARDTLRTEMGYPLHGHELSLSITPVEASASWAVSWDKNFWGKTQLATQRETKNHRVMQALQVTDRGIPRAGMQVKNDSGEVIGVVTSGTFSPSLKTGIALALLNQRQALESRVFIDVRGRTSEASVKRLPFLPSHVK